MKHRFAALCGCAVAALLLSIQPVRADSTTCEKLTPEDQLGMTKAAILDKYCVYLKRMKEREKTVESTNASMRTLAEASQCKKESGKLREQLERQFEIKDPHCP